VHDVLWGLQQQSLWCGAVLTEMVGCVHSYPSLCCDQQIFAQVAGHYAS
jgi:hypothetical protein